MANPTLDQLAAMIADHIASKPKRRPALHLLPPPPARLLDPIMRQAYIRRITDLRRWYRLDWLVRQEAFGHDALETVTDEGLIALLSTMERARECICDGVSLEDAGLIRTPPGAASCFE